MVLRRYHEPPRLPRRICGPGGYHRAGPNPATLVILAGPVADEVLARVGRSWRSMWDVSRPQGPADFEQEAAKLLSAWRAGLFELPDYYLVTATSAGGGEPSDPGEPGPDFHLGPLRSVRPHRVAFVAAAEPAQQAAGILHTLGSLQPGRWWPGLDEVIETARGFYPGRLAEAAGR